MIRVVQRCLSKHKISEYRWNLHPAFLHFKTYKNAILYTKGAIQGKPLKWYHILKDGDIIEVIDKPSGIFTTLSLIFTALMVAHPVALTLGVLAVTGAIVAGVSALITSTSTSGSTTSQEYSSSTQAELTGASNDISTSILPVLFGKTQQTPNYGQLPYRNVGDGSSTNKYHCYFIPNYKNVVYSDFKLEDTSINDYSVDYIDIDTASGSSTFIGFDNCKPIDVNEQLSYDSEGEVNQSNNYNYNQSVTATSIVTSFIVEFTNVDISNWGTKNFTLTVNTLYSSVATASSQAFAVASGDLTLVSGTTYRYTGSKTFTVTADTLVSTSFAPTSYTRANSTEVSNELEAVYVSETITAGTYSNTQTFNQGVNYYVGTTSEVIQTSPANTTEIDVIISFPSGLYTLNTSGTRLNRTAKIEIDYKLSTDSAWSTISSASSLYIRQLDGTKGSVSSSTTTVSGNVVTVNSPSDLNLADQLFFRPIGFVVPAGKYNVRVRSADYADKTNYDVGYPYCAEVQFRMTGNPVNTAILPKVNQIAFTATAYKGLSGTIKKFNYIAEAVIPVWDGTDWSTTAKTTNPAAIIRWILTDSYVNPRAISTDYIDNDSLVELYEWCEDESYLASGIITDETTIIDVLNNVLANCQGAMIPLLNGKHTFVIDKTGKTPLGLFNQHNIIAGSFKWSSNIGRVTEAIRGSFLDNDDYTQDERTLYYWSDGTVSQSPEGSKTDDDYEIVKKDYKYVNDESSLLKIMEFDLRTIQEKRNTFEFDVNLEGLNQVILDRVYVSNTTNMNTESTGLIKSIILDGTNLTGFELYSEIEIPENAQIIIRSLDYTNEIPVIYVYEVTNNGLTNIVNIEPILYNGNIRGTGEITGVKDKWYYDGDLFSLGQSEVYDCTITNIQYNEDNTATITTRDY